MKYIGMLNITILCVRVVILSYVVSSGGRYILNINILKNIYTIIKKYYVGNLEKIIYLRSRQ